MGFSKTRGLMQGGRLEIGPCFAADPVIYILDHIVEIDDLMVLNWICKPHLRNISGILYADGTY